MINKVTLIGNLGGEPEKITFEGGGSIAKCSLATTEKWKDKTSGEKKEETQWHNLIFHGKVVDLVMQYLHKGSKIYCEGRIIYRSWEKEGVKHYMTEINVQTVKFLSPKSERQTEAPPTLIGSQEQPDDLPF